MCYTIKYSNENYFHFYFIYYSQGGAQMKDFTMFKLNKHTYSISGSTFVRPNWDIDNERGRLEKNRGILKNKEDHIA